MDDIQITERPDGFIDVAVASDQPHYLASAVAVAVLGYFSHEVSLGHMTNDEAGAAYLKVLDIAEALTKGKSYMPQTDTFE